MVAYSLSWSLAMGVPPRSKGDWKHFLYLSDALIPGKGQFNPSVLAWVTPVNQHFSNFYCTFMKDSRKLWLQIPALYILQNKWIRFLVWNVWIQMQRKRFISVGDTCQPQNYCCQSLFNNENNLFIPFHRLCVAFVILFIFTRFINYLIELSFSKKTKKINKI